MKNNRYGKIRHNAITLLWLLTASISLLKLMHVEIPMPVVYAYGAVGAALIAVMLFAGRKSRKK